MADRYKNLMNQQKPIDKIEAFPIELIAWQQSEGHRLNVDPNAQVELIKASWWLWRICQAANVECDWHRIYTRLCDDNADRLRRTV